MKTRILITGASGFAGRKIVDRFLRMDDIALSCLARNTGSFPLFAKAPSITVYKGDITKPDTLVDAVNDNDVIIHCAALMSNFDDQPRERFYEVNVLGTEHLLRACDPKRIRQFIHISTAGIYGPVRGKEADEEVAYGTKLSVYEWSKSASERAVARLAEEKSIPFTILRPSQMYGSGMYYGWVDTIKALKSGTMVIPGKGESKIHLLHVDDLVRAVSAALLHTAAFNRIYNIAGPEIASLNEVFGTIAKILGTKKPKHIPYLPVYFGSFLLNFVPRHYKGKRLALLTPHRVRFFSEDHRYDTSRAHNELRYQPEVGIERGFREMIAWCEKEGLA